MAKSKSNSAVLEIQYGALPYRFTDTGGIEILLVTSRSRRRWILPKGLPVEGLEPSEAAAREAFEEAGVRGTVRSEPIGRFTYDRRVDEDGRSISCEVAVYPLEVVRQHQIWPAVWQRETRWLAPGEAAALIGDAGLKPLLQAFAAKMTARRRPASRRTQA
ncbi:NUDIX hydrolase [Shinella sp. G-2]|uniref:NUDIX hydrolase n=1 Tax=Shinella sp. G-2 TaxID=3133141 RepID=UPI003CFF06BC